MKGSHSGYCKREGTRLPTKVLWMRKMRVSRRLLKKPREQRTRQAEKGNMPVLLAKGPGGDVPAAACLLKPHRSQQ
ncbi:unnamed protein product [Brassica rapa]|uniref:Ribosomal protein L19e C-terminal domain-containing protein n=1 Tax=Brassica campestris TaxID=3711 RepID=A0A8D9FYP9_BRACM|nr:unnamed protein product [Brassica rapa]